MPQTKTSKGLAQASKSVAPIPKDAPGRVGTRAHGLAQPLQRQDGVGLLRDALHVSLDVPVDQLCRDAAATIERLGGNQEPPQLTNELAKVG